MITKRKGHLFRRRAKKIYRADDPAAPKDANYWVAVCYKLPGMAQSKRAAFNLKTTDLATAEQRRVEVLAPYQYSDEAHFLAGLKVQAQYAADRLAHVAPSRPLAEVWPAFLKTSAARGQSAATLANYESHWMRFCRWLPETVKCVRDVTPGVAQAYDEALSTLASSTHNQHTGLLSMIWKALPEGRNNPWSAKDLGRRRAENHPYRRLNNKEVAIVVERAPEARRPVGVLLAHTALRLGDVCTLRSNEVNMAKEIIERVNAKTGNLSVIAMSKAVAAVVTDHLQRCGPDDYLFPDAAERYLRDRSTESKWWRQHFKLCQIPDTSAGKASVHSFRKTVRSLFAENGVPETVINKWMGHSGVGTGQKSYTEIEWTILKAAVQFLPRLSQD